MSGHRPPVRLQDIASIDFHLDIACPWTFAAALSVADLSARLHIPVQWRPVSLTILHEGTEIPPQFAAPMAVSSQGLRAVASMGRAGRFDLAGEFYLRAGGRVFEKGQRLTVELLADSLEAVGAADYIPTLDDPGLDPVVRAEHDAAMSLVGEGVGSPIMIFRPGQFALYGPVLAEPVLGPEAESLFAAMVALAGDDRFCELKRAHLGHPRFPTRD